MRRKLKKNNLYKYNSSQNIVSLEQKYKIGVLVATTSFKKNYYSIEDYIFLNEPLNSFIKTCSKNNFYNFYLGYDEDDIFISKNIEEITKKFLLITNNSNFSITFVEMKNLKGKVGEIWSKLAQNAKEECNDYLFQIGDDIIFKSENWDCYFIKKLLHNNNLGCVGPYDISIENSLLTQSFVHVKHLDIFENYFPPEIINWGIDGWITHVYGGLGDYNIKINNSNTGRNVRYKPVSDTNNYLKIKKRDLKILNNYLPDIHITKDINDLLPNKILTIILQGEEQIIRFINKVKWSANKYLQHIQILLVNNHSDNLINNINSNYVTFLNTKDLVSDDFFSEFFKINNSNYDIITFIAFKYVKEFLKNIEITNYEYTKKIVEHNYTYKKKEKYNIYKTKEINNIKTHIFLKKIMYHIYD